MRRILGIETLGGGRFLVQTEEGDAFPMYKGRAFVITAFGKEKSWEKRASREIMEELLPNRAKKKALHLLERMDRTETQLSPKADGAEISEGDCGRSGLIRKKLPLHR